MNTLNHHNEEKEKQELHLLAPRYCALFAKGSHLTLEERKEFRQLENLGCYEHTELSECEECAKLFSKAFEARVENDWSTSIDAKVWLKVEDEDYDDLGYEEEIEKKYAGKSQNDILNDPTFLAEEICRLKRIIRAVIRGNLDPEHIKMSR